MRTPTPFPLSVPSVCLLETPLGASPELAHDLLLQWTVCQASGAGPLAAPEPRRVLLVDLRQPREALQRAVQDTGRLPGVELTEDTPLRVLGRSKGAIWQPLWSRLDAVRRDFAPDLVVLAGAEQIPGTGFDWQGRDAWGLDGPWGAGRCFGPLGWQRTYADAWNVQFVNHFTARPGSLYTLEAGTFKRNATQVATFRPERQSEPQGRQVLTDASSRRRLARRTRAGVWLAAGKPALVCR